MADRAQELQAIALFIESYRIMHGVELVIRTDHVEDFPDFILSDPIANHEIWVEVVQAVSAEPKIFLHLSPNFGAVML